jgi:signal peptidase I
MSGLKAIWGKLPSSVRKFTKEWILPVGLAIIVAGLFRTTIASPRHIPTGSMVPTIKIGEFIFVKMFTYDIHIPFTRSKWIHRNNPQPGDVVVFEYPVDPDKDYIKRVIGVPGDVVEVRNKRIILNGEPLPLERVEDKSTLADAGKNYQPETMSLFREELNGKSYYVAHMNSRSGVDMEAFRVPPDSFFVMGDNRDDSSDSRSWGVVPREMLLGQGSFIWFSFNIKDFPFVRWNRLFSALR